MTELENLRLALRNALTMPLPECTGDDLEMTVTERVAAIAHLRRRISELESEQRGSYNGRQ